MAQQCYHRVLRDHFPSIPRETALPNRVPRYQTMTPKELDKMIVGKNLLHQKQQRILRLHQKQLRIFNPRHVPLFRNATRKSNRPQRSTLTSSEKPRLTSIRQRRRTTGHQPSVEQKIGTFQLLRMESLLGYDGRAVE